MSAINLVHVEGGRKTPLIRQAEASECGLACLAMVAGNHGLQTDLPSMRRRFSMSLKGVTLKTLIGMAEQVGFNCRPLRAEIDELSRVAFLGVQGGTQPLTHIPDIPRQRDAISAEWVRRFTAEFDQQAQMKEKDDASAKA